MELEISKLTRNFPFEDIYKHDVHHCLHKKVCTIRAYVGQFLHPVGVVVVFPDLEFKFEGVSQRYLIAFLLSVHHFYQCHKKSDGLIVCTVQIVFIRKEVQLSDVKTVLVVKMLNVQQLLHQTVVAFHRP